MRHLARLALGFVGLIPGLVLLVGCGGESASYTFNDKVEGTATYHKMPLKHVTIQFIPIVSDTKLKSVEGAPSSSARTDASGRFVMLRNDGSGKSGALIGLHKVVAVVSRADGDRGRADEDNPDAQKMSRPILPIRFANPAQTPLTIEITPEKSNYDIEFP